MIDRLLRIIVVAIALAALIDPSLTLAARQHSRIAVAIQQPGDETAGRIRDRLARDLRRDADVVDGLDPDAAAAVVIGDRYPAAGAVFSARTSTVTIDAARGVPRIASVKAPPAVPRGTTIQLEVDLDGGTANGSTSVVSVSAGSAGRPDVVVARATHTWSAGAPRAALRIDAVPLDAPPWQLRIRLSDAGQPAAPTSGEDVLVAEAAPMSVLFYEPRPSWIATFVRRAIERDSRFVVGGVDYPSRGIRISIGDATSLDPEALSQTAAVIVGGLDRLSPADRDALDRFSRLRGGSLVLLPDAPLGAGPARDWLPSDFRQVLLERPAALAVEAPLPAIQASEILTVPGATVPGSTVQGAKVPGTSVPGARVLARTSGSNDAVVMVTPHGAGRILWSGALDAWRYRAEQDAAFDRFWRSVVAGMALATDAPVDVTVAPSVVLPGETARVTAHIHRGAFAVADGRPLQVTARLDSGEPLRMWPDAGADIFSGSFTANTPALRGITVTASDDEGRGATGAALVVVDPAARHAESMRTPLALLAASHGGINVTPDRLPDLEDHLRREISAPTVRSTTHPMRSTWWMVPFAACLGGEWWVRRRRGLR